MLSPSKSILYVEDHLDTVELIKLFLSGYEVTVAYTCAQALSLIQGRGFDLYLLDNWLVDGSGVELCRQIREVDPHTPILFYSGVGGEAAQREALKAGAQGYLLKPVNLAQLEQLIRRLIGEAASAVFEARRAEMAALRDELTLARLEAGAKLARAQARLARAEEQSLKLKACGAFLKAGGTRAEFERLWPEVFRAQVLACPSEPSPSELPR